MNSDNATKAPAPAWRHAGSGHSSTFLCAKCAKGRTMLGRTMRMVHGVRQWVCVDCAKGQKPV